MPRNRRQTFRLSLLFGAFVGLAILVRLGPVVVAFDKIDLSPPAAFLLLLVVLAASSFDLRLFSVRADEEKFNRLPSAVQKALLAQRVPYATETAILLNLGRGLTPLIFAIYLTLHHPLSLRLVFVATAIVTVVADLTRRPVLRPGIVMPIAAPPVVAALMAAYLDPDQRSALTLVSATLGVLIGVDLMHLDDLRNMGRPVAAIGSADSLEGILLAAFLAVLLT